MMADILRGFNEVRRLWKLGRISKLDWDDFEWTLEQAGLEYTDLLTHLRHLEEDFTEAEGAIANGQETLCRLGAVRRELEKTREEALFREQNLLRELNAAREELARAREEAELIVRSQRDDVPLFEEEGNDGDG